MSETFTVTVSGCDDSTTVEIEGDYIYLRSILALAEAVNAASDYSCQPTIQVSSSERGKLT